MNASYRTMNDLIRRAAGYSLPAEPEPAEPRQAPGDAGAGTGSQPPGKPTQAEVMNSRLRRAAGMTWITPK